MITGTQTRKGRRKFIVMVGTAAKGGMRSVVEAYQRDGLFDRYQIRLLFSHDEGSIWTRLSRAASAVASCLAFLLNNRVSAFHLHVSMYGSFWRKSLIACIADIFRIPVIMHLHGSDLHIFFAQQPLWRKRLIRTRLESCDVVVVLSSSWQQFVHTIAPRARVVELPNYVPVPKHSHHVKALRQPCVFFFSGRVGVRKGVFDLLPAFHEALRSGLAIQLRIAGDGDLEKARVLVNQLELQESVTLLGWLSATEIQLELQKADVFVLPSFNEGLPMSLLEAMACGLPVITSRVGGIPEAVTDGVNGLLIDAGSVLSLAQSMVLLAGDPNLRSSLGQAAQDTIRNRFSAEIILPRLQHIYDLLLSRTH